MNILVITEYTYSQIYGFLVSNCSRAYFGSNFLKKYTYIIEIYHNGLSKIKYLKPYLLEKIKSSCFILSKKNKDLVSVRIFKYGIEESLTFNLFRNIKR